MLTLYLSFPYFYLYAQSSQNLFNIITIYSNYFQDCNNIGPMNCSYLWKKTKTNKIYNQKCATSEINVKYTSSYKLNMF